MAESENARERDSTNDTLRASRPGGPGHRAPRRYGPGIVVAVAVGLFLVGMGGGYLLGTAGGGGSPAKVDILESGSTLLGPLFEIWAPNYTALNPNVQITPDLTGSGTGISQAEAGTVDIGATDAYLTPQNASAHNLINVPVAISAQLIMYNLPGLNNVHLNLNGTILAKIYAGVITHWNDPEIQAANPQYASQLPDATIIPLHRSDGSGDTFMFTSLCYLSWKGWPYSYGTSVQWLSSSPGYNGNGGMVQGLSTTPDGVAYIGISFLNEALADGLGYAALGDQAANLNGTNPANYILPTPQNISEDANLGLMNLQPPSVAISLILGGVPGATALVLGHGGTLPTVADPTPYPDVNLEYTLISTHPADPAKQKYVVQFLEWALSYGNAPVYLDQVHFLPLTPAIVGYDMEALASVPVSG
jgi:phosphate transport system substrate-binding protein